MICLLPHCSYLSETSRMLELHRALTELGVPVRVATHGGPHVRLLSEAGVRYDLLGPGLSPTRSAAFVGSAVGLGDPRQSMYTDDEIRDYAQLEAEYFRAHGITVAVTGFTVTTLLSTRLAGVHLVTEHAGSFVPPMFEHRLLPTPSQPLDPRLAHAPKWLSRHLANRSPNRIPAYCAGFNRVADSLGVEGVPSLAALLLGDLTLVPEVPEVMGLTDRDLESWTPAGRTGYRPSTRLTAVGPLYAHLDLPVPAHVQHFLDRPGPVVYVAMTSTPPQLVRTAVTALAKLDVRLLVAGTIHDLGDLATDRIMVEGVLPSHLVMPQVDLAVTTAGQGSTQTAAASGTPLLGIPLHLEQDLNIALLERQGAARHLAPTKLAGLPAVATDLLDTPTYKEAAHRLQTLYAATDGPAESAKKLAALVEGG